MSGSRSSWSCHVMDVVDEELEQAGPAGQPFLRVQVSKCRGAWRGGQDLDPGRPGQWGALGHVPVTVRVQSSSRVVPVGAGSLSPLFHR